jgi:Skp family chaperone for outer membrane proteins
VLKIEVQHERQLRESAVGGMMTNLQNKKKAIKRRADFERWRHEVASEAANEAFNTSAGRLKKNKFRKSNGKRKKIVLYELKSVQHFINKMF